MKRSALRSAGYLGAMAIVIAMASQEAAAHSARLGDIEIGHLWAKPSADGSLAVLGPLLNLGHDADRLIAARSSAAGSVAFYHQSGGKDERLSAIEVPPGRPVSLAPWSQDIRLTLGGAAAKAGDAIPLTLVFAHAGSLTVDILVQNAPTD